MRLNVAPPNAARPGFQIAELQISPTETIPWHYHSEVQDTFYVITGSIRIFTREPEEQVCLTAGQTYAVRPRRPHLVTNAVTRQLCSLFDREWASTISLLLSATG